MTTINLARKHMGAEWDILADEIKRMLVVMQEIAAIVENPVSDALKEIRDLTDKEFSPR